MHWYCSVAKERAYDLAQLCTELVRKGNDFPTVWTTVLKGNALVDGIPQSKHDGTRPVLEIRLITPYVCHSFHRWWL